MFEVKDEDYRKARKESKDKITKVIKVWSAREETLHDTGFQEGAEFGFNKANEWHYPSKGEYPKNENDILCQIYKDIVVVGYFHQKYKQYYTTSGEWLETVIAWKEIVLPKF